MSFDRFKKACSIARSHASVRPAVGAYSRIRARFRRGGMVLTDATGLMEAILGRPTERSHEDYRLELKQNKVLRGRFTAMAELHDNPKFADYDKLLDGLTGQIALFYGLLREVRPDLVVETGTATGSMTAIELAALEKNGGGRLISIDLPASAGALTMDSTVAEDDTGFFIPPEYRPMWKYRKGDAKLLVPRVLADEAVDVFIHDSLHTRSHMIFEYAVARALLRPGALILSDDVLWNNGFDDFLMMNELTGFAPFCNPNIAGVVNRFDDFEAGVGKGIVRT